jgi:hypothetical protein
VRVMKVERSDAGRTMTESEMKSSLTIKMLHRKMILVQGEF